MSDSLSNSKRLLAIAFLWLAGLTAAAQFSKISVTFSLFEDIYPDAGPSIGLLLSMISFLGVILGLFAGLLIARYGYKRMLISALIFGAAISLIQSTFPRFELMLTLRILEGFSHLAIVVAAPTLIAQLAAPRYVSLCMTIWSTFFGVAFVTTSWFGIPLVNHYGLPALFHTLAGLMIIFAIILTVLIPTAFDKKNLNIKLNPAEIFNRHIRAYRSPFMSAPAIGWLCYTLTYVSLITIIPTLLPEADRAAFISLISLIGIVTSIAGGLLLLPIIAPTNALILSFLSASATLSLYWFGLDIQLVCIATFTILGIIQSASFAAVPYLNKTAEEQAQANGAMAQMGNLGNAIGTPLLLLVIAHFQLDGMIAAIIAFYLFGAFMHIILDHRRKNSTSA